MITDERYMLTDEKRIIKRLMYNKSFLTIINLEALDMAMSNPIALDIMAKYLDTEIEDLIEFAFNTERVFLSSSKDDEDYKDFFYEKLYDALLEFDQDMSYIIKQLDGIMIRYTEMMDRIKI